MRKEDISFHGALKVIERIAADDEEKSARIRTLEETYKKEDLDNVCGYSGLFSILLNQTQSEDMTRQLLEQVIALFPGKQSKDLPSIEKSQSQNLIELSHTNVSLFFKDQHDITRA
jgi:hypothetical protein